MALVLTTMRWPDYAVPESRRVEGGDYLIGRDPGCHWILPSPERELSKQHCVLEFRAGSWQVRDRSTNGTYLNHAADRIGHDRVVALNDGDRLRLGPYEIEVQVEFAAENGRDWDAPLPGASVGAGLGSWAPNAGTENDHSEEPVMSDLRATTGDAFLPPLPHQPLNVLPEDWDTDFTLPGRIASTPGREAAAPPLTLPHPFDDPPLGAAQAPKPAPTTKDRGADLGPSTEPPPFQPTAVLSGESRTTAAHAASPPTVLAQPGPPTGAAPASGRAMAAFLTGAGLAPTAAPVAEPETALRTLGAAFRAAVVGLRGLLIARAGVKRVFRIEQTILRGADNNPVKFAATHEAAIAALVAAGEGAERTIAETIADLKAHEVATVAATQGAARALLDRLAPARLEAEAENGGLFGTREKRLWEAYRRLHTQVAAQLQDDFDSAFGKAFARIYEEVVAADRRGDEG